MSNTTTVINATQIINAARELGVAYVEQTSFHKLTNLRKALYVSKTKRRVTRIDISGYEVEHPAVRPPTKPNGKVTGQVDLSHPLAIEAIRSALELLSDSSLEGDKLVAKPRKEVA